MEKRKLYCSVGRNVNWYSHYGEQYRQFFNKLRIKLPCDPAIPLLGMDPEETITEREACTPGFASATLQELGHGSSLDVH